MVKGIAATLLRLGSQARPLPQRSDASEPTGKIFTRPFVIGVIVCVLSIMCWRATRHYATGVFDFYPLYYGGKAWLHTGNAYDLLAVAPEKDHGFQLLRIGNIYPLPAVLVTLPLSFLPPQAAGVVWIGLLSLGLLLGVRLNGWPHSGWYLLYLPLLEGWRIEQYTAFVIVLQLFALWALRERRPWLLAVCSALIVTKPNQGFFFVLALLLIGRHWRQLLVVGAAIWGGSLLLDPHWITEWIPTLVNHNNTLHQPFLWPLALFAIPLFYFGETIAGAIVLQFLMMPYPGIYAMSAVPLPFLRDVRTKWIIAGSYGWMVLALLLGQPWANAVAIVLPFVCLAGWRHYQLRQHAATSSLLAPSGAD